MRAFRVFANQWLAIVFPLLGGAGCGDTPHRIDIQPDDIRSTISNLPVGDSLKLRATLWSEAGAVTAERKLYPGLLGFKWHVDMLTRGPYPASVTPGPIIHAQVPGKIRVTASARGISASVDIDIEWPLDSIELRFAAHTVRVGDTVELIHRAHFNTGEIATESFRGYYADGLEPPSPQRGERSLKDGWTVNPIHTNAINWYPEMNRDLGDTVLFVAQRPGVFRVGGSFYNRWAEDTLRIEPRAGTPRSFRQRNTDALIPKHAAVECFTLEFGEWTMDGDKWPSNWPPPKEYFDWVPKTVALDTTPLVRASPGSGYRMDAARGPATHMGRYWVNLGGDSIEFRMLSPKEFPRRNRIPLWIRVGLLQGTGISGNGGDDEISVPVSGRRISCAESE